MSKVFLYKDEDGEVLAEYAHDVVFIHCNITNWSLSTYKKCNRLLPSILAQLDEPCVFTLIPSGDSKLYKWQTMFGFVEVGNLGDLIMFKKEL
jgi:hypothetical protein